MKRFFIRLFLYLVILIEVVLLITFLCSIYGGKQTKDAIKQPVPIEEFVPADINEAIQQKLVYLQMLVNEKYRDLQKGDFYATE